MMGYQQKVEEVLALHMYVGEVQAQVACFEDVLRQLPHV